MHRWLSEAHIFVLNVVLQPHIHNDFSEYQLLALIFWLLTLCPLREKWLMSESLPQVFCIWHVFKPCFTLKGLLSWTQFISFLSVHQLPSCLFNNCWTFYFLSAVNSMLRAQSDSSFFKLYCEVVTEEHLWDKLSICWCCSDSVLQQLSAPQAVKIIEFSVISACWLLVYSWTLNGRDLAGLRK